MKVLADVFDYYAQCNKLINTNLLEIIKANDIFNKTLPGYYKSINDILFHILDVDLSWMSDLKQTIDSEIYEEALFKSFDEKNSTNPYKTIIGFEKDRIKLDNLFIKFVHELRAQELEKAITYKPDKTKKVWEVLIHTFNHQTHHRGQISQILDENGINNDFSNMIRYDIKI
ncbi:MAG: hypothetical protein LBT16_03255 [Treponema sp.]|jgi:uncharacterized damage-inducible protein DinB|nr:hypothetical protein [Treponema sp.]